MNVSKRAFKEPSFITEAFRKETKLCLYTGGVSLEKQSAVSTILICYIHHKETKSITKSVLQAQTH